MVEVSQGGRKIARKISPMCFDGNTLEEVMQLTGLSYFSVYRKSRLYEKKKLIERTMQYPLTFALKRSVRNMILQPLKPVGDFAPVGSIPLFITHKFGSSFNIMRGRAPVHYNTRGFGKTGDKSHKAQWGRGVCTIWLKEVYLGLTPEEILKNGRALLLSLADQYAQKFNMELSHKQFYEDIEWVLNDKPASAETAQKAGIAKHKQMPVYDVLAKYSDSSDLDHLQFNQLPGHSPAAPTEFVKVLHLAAANRPALTYLLERGPEQLAAMTQAMQATADAVISIKTAQEVMMQEIKKIKEGDLGERKH